MTVWRSAPALRILDQLQEHEIDPLDFAEKVDLSIGTVINSYLPREAFETLLTAYREAS